MRYRRLDWVQAPWTFLQEYSHSRGSIVTSLCELQQSVPVRLSLKVPTTLAHEKRAAQSSSPQVSCTPTSQNQLSAMEVSRCVWNDMGMISVSNSIEVRGCVGNVPWHSIKVSHSVRNGVKMIPVSNSIEVCSCMGNVELPRDDLSRVVLQPVVLLRIQ